MVKIKQCCCGCSLQTTASMLIWLTLFGSSVWTISILITLSNAENFSEKLGNNDPYSICFLLFYLYFGLIHPILGFITSALGIIGVQKGKAVDYLMPYLYYMGYSILLCILYIIFVTISSSSYSKISSIDSRSELGIIIETLIIFMIFIALFIFFWVVVKSYGDSIMRTSLSLHVPHQFHPSAPSLEL